MSLLDFQNVSYTSDNKNILTDITIKINPGDFISIIGPSGSGKSTFLKLCCHLISPTDGKIVYKDKDIQDYEPMDIRKNISYCFQTPYLFGDSVRENLAFPYSIRNRKIDLKRIHELISVFNLDEDILDKGIQKLSGGEKQRISLIRTLLFRPEVLLLDEVTSALDETNKIIVEDVIDNLNKDGVTVLWVTHNQEQSRKFSNRILTIEDGILKSEEVLK